MGEGLSSVDEGEVGLGFQVEVRCTFGLVVLVDVSLAARAYYLYSVVVPFDSGSFLEFFHPA